jgi:putative transposase
MKERQGQVISFHKGLSKRVRAKLLGVNLSGCYVERKPVSRDTVTLMNEIRDIYAMRPFQGYRRITLDLKDSGYEVNHKKVYRLMKLMGLQAVYPKMNLSKRRQSDAVYPYLLKEHPPLTPHDVWCVDITYLRIGKGFIYLTALIDVVSRCVTGWNISPFLDTQSCLDALEMALKGGFKPLIINSDQGCQFTSQEWVYSLSLLGIKISMDGKGRCLDNIPIERFWRTVKYEEVYLRAYETVAEARESLGRYIEWYNRERRHSGLQYQRPYDVMKGIGQAIQWPFQKVEQDGFAQDIFVNDGSASATIIHKTYAAPKIKTKQQKEKKMINLSSKIAA